MLRGCTPVGFVATTDLGGARAFYVDVLGLEVVEESDFALVVRSGPIVVRIAPVESYTAQPFTVLGWEVDDIEAAIDRLVDHGVEMKRFDVAEQDERGIWVPPGGAKVAWFEDPDGNLLSVVQEPTGQEPIEPE